MTQTSCMDIAAAIASRPGGFGLPEACRLSRASVRQIDYWDRTGVVWPSISEASGTGSRRKWAFEDLVAASVLVTIQESSESSALEAFRNKALPMAIHLHADTFGDWDAWLLIHDGDPILMPSAEAAWARMKMLQEAAPGGLFCFADIGCHAHRIAKEILDGPSPV